MKLCCKDIGVLQGYRGAARIEHGGEDESKGHTRIFRALAMSAAAVQLTNTVLCGVGVEVALSLHGDFDGVLS